MGKRKVSVQASRNALLERMTVAEKDKTVKVIQFANNDVPEYLQNLRQFEQWSRNSGKTIIVK